MYLYLLPSFLPYIFPAFSCHLLYLWLLPVQDVSWFHQSRHSFVPSAWWIGPSDSLYLPRTTIRTASTKFGVDDSICCEERERDDLRRAAGPRLSGSLGSSDNFGPTVTFVFLPVIVSWWSGHGPDHRKGGTLGLVASVKRQEPPCLKVLGSNDVISKCLNPLSFPFRHYREGKATKCPIIMAIIISIIIIIIIIVNSEQFSCFSKSTYRWPSSHYSLLCWRLSNCTAYAKCYCFL